MGYTTYFTGEFTLDRPLTIEHRTYLKTFSETRRMKRDASKTAEREDKVREAVGLPIGEDAAYFVGATADFGQEHTSDIVNYNRPPTGQPGLWCKWEPNEEGTAILWNEAEKFYDYVEWLAYLIEHFLEPWGYKLNGVVEWSGEEDEDVGRIHVRDNKVAAKQAEIVHPEPDWD